MDRIYSLLCLFGILTFYVVGIAAREAIVGGVIATYPLVRYQVTIAIADYSPRCGGGILDNYFVLTAAHCVLTPKSHLIGKPVSVLAETYDLEKAGVVVEVAEIVVPAYYNPSLNLSIGDVAVLKLRKSLEIKTHSLKKLHIPRNYLKSYDSDTVLIAGVGWNQVNNQVIGGHSDNRLRLAHAEVRSDIECMRDHPHLDITEKHLCARVKHKGNDAQRHGACIGDGGGPLVGNRDTVVGILSVTAPGCSERTSSAIYTRITHYHKFILGIKNNGIRKNTLKFYV